MSLTPARKAQLCAVLGALALALQTKRIEEMPRRVLVRAVQRTRQHERRRGFERCGAKAPGVKGQHRASVELETERELEPPDQPHPRGAWPRHQSARTSSGTAFLR